MKKFPARESFVLLYVVHVNDLVSIWFADNIKEFWNK